MALNGIHPIFIIQLYKKADTRPVLGPEPPPGTKKTDGATAKTVTRIPLPPIPIYLDPQITKLEVVSESKNIDIKTEAESKLDSSPGGVNQKLIGSITTVEIEGTKDSIGLMLLLAFTEMLLEKLAAADYSITYANGATTVFQGLIHGFSVTPGSNDTKINIKLEISKGQPRQEQTGQVPRDPNGPRLASTGTAGALPPSSPPVNPAASAGGSTTAIGPGGLR